ncbi:MAG TPA: hypothetical protein DEB09_03865 [Candidatus Magasanikbacteria bacterium]|nr:hypothetical protein [Candidatus Magasanikbacteria bacterium]
MDQKSKLPSYEVGGVKGGWSEITTVLDEDGKLIPEIEDALWGLWGLRAISYQQVDRIINEIGLVVQNSKDGNVDWESAPTLNMAFDEYSSRLRGLEKIKEWSVEKLRQLHTRLLESQKGALEMHSKAEEALRKKTEEKRKEAKEKKDRLVGFTYISRTNFEGMGSENTVTYIGNGERVWVRNLNAKEMGKINISGFDADDFVAVVDKDANTVLVNIKDLDSNFSKE